MAELWHIHLVLLAGGSRGLDQLLQDSQTHESDVLHHYRSLYIHRHEEQTEGYRDKKIQCYQTKNVVVMSSHNDFPNTIKAV